MTAEFESESWQLASSVEWVHANYFISFYVLTQ